MASVLPEELIAELASIAHPAPRHGEVDPPEQFEEVTRQRARQRQDYAAAVRATFDATGEDPLLAALRAAASTRDDAADLLRRLIAYGRHFTGQRPDYTWENLAEAGGLTYSTARRTVTQDDVDQVKTALDNPRYRWPSAVANLDVHRAHAVLDGFAIADAPRDLEADAEFLWWKGKVHALRRDARSKADTVLMEKVQDAVQHWRTTWLNAIYPRAQHYRRLSTQLGELADTQHHEDPSQRYVPNEADQLTAIIEKLTDLRDQLVVPRSDTLN